MLGGRCYRASFVNMRKTEIRNAQDKERCTKTGGRYDLAHLDGFTDIYDGALYSEAHAIFWTDVRRLKLGKQRCQKICSDAAEQFDAMPGVYVV